MKLKELLDVMESDLKRDTDLWVLYKGLLYHRVGRLSGLLACNKYLNYYVTDMYLQPEDVGHHVSVFVQKDVVKG